MADNKDKKDYRDRSQVNSNEHYEVEYWSKKWNITPDELKETIKNSGTNSVEKLQKYLNQ